MKIVFTIPLNNKLIVSEFNMGGEFWKKKQWRHKQQEFYINEYFNTFVVPYEEQGFFPLPCIVKMTRITPRQLDEDDNLRGSVKYFKDYIAARLIPGDKSGGMKDSDKRIKWEYAQEKGIPHQYALRVEIEN